jgi:hypothetical protein
MTKFVKLLQLRAIALAADVKCDVATAIRNSLEAHAGHKDGHLVSVPESISCLIGLPEAEVTKVLMPAPEVPAVASVGPHRMDAPPPVTEPAPVISEPGPVVSEPASVISEPAPAPEPAPEVPPASLTPDPLG